MAAMLGTSPRDFFNLSCPVKIVQEKNARGGGTDELNEFRKHTSRKLRVALRNNVPANWDSCCEA